MKEYYLRVSIAEKITATDWSKRLIIAAKGSGAQSLFNTDDRVRDHAIGFLGEMKFGQFLKKNGVDILHNLHFDGEGDSHDFFKDGHRIDVKTGFCKNVHDLPRKWKFLIPESQLGKATSIYVSSQVDKESCCLKGWITREKALEYPTQRGAQYIYPCKAIPFSDLRAMSELLLILKGYGVL